MANHRKLDLSPEQLRELYVEQGLSQQVIGDMSHVSQVTVGNYLLRYGIQTRPSCGRQKVYLDKKELRRLYREEGLSVDAVAERLRCSDTCVRHNLTRYGLRLNTEEIRTRQVKTNGARVSVLSSGYRTILKPDHPFADKRGFVLESRIIVETAIGRVLEADVIFHHINFRKRDNRIENLAVLPTQSDHALVHRYMERVGAYFCGLGAIRPEPVDFGSPVFWGGAWVTTIDLIQGVESTPCQTPLVDQTSKGDAAAIIN